jgi:hypothetical protein
MSGLYPAALVIVLAVWLGLLPWAAARLRRRLTAAKPATGVLVFTLVLGAAVLRLAVVSPAHQVYYDEFEHLDAARQLARTGIFAETVVGGLPSWDVLTRPTWPAGHHAALAAVMTLAGSSASVAFAWSGVLSALTVLLLFWAALEISGDERGALAAAFLWTVSPVVLRYAAACDLTSSSLFFIAAALAALHAREAEPSPSLDVFAAASLAYAVQVRFENVLLLPYAAAVCSRRVLLLPAALGLIAPAALVWSNHAAAVPGFAGLSPWANFVRQAPSNLLYLAGPAALGLLLLPSLAFALALPPSRRLLVLATAYFAVYASFYHSRFDTSSNDRFALSVLLPLTVAAAPGLATMSVPVCLLATGLAWGGPASPDVEHAAARRFLERSAKLIAEKTFIATFNPSFVREAARRPAAGVFLILEDLPAFEVARARAGSAPELALYKDWAWRSRPEATVRLEKALSAGYDSKVVADNGLDSLVLLSPALRERR